MKLHERLVAISQNGDRTGSHYTACQPTVISTVTKADTIADG